MFNKPPPIKEESDEERARKIFEEAIKNVK